MPIWLRGIQFQVLGCFSVPTVVEGLLAKYVYYQATDDGGGPDPAMSIGDSHSSTVSGANDASSSRDTTPRSGGLARCKWVIHSLDLTRRGSNDTGKDIAAAVRSIIPILRYQKVIIVCGEGRAVFPIPNMSSIPVRSAALPSKFCATSTIQPLRITKKKSPANPPPSAPCPHQKSSYTLLHDAIDAIEDFSGSTAKSAIMNIPKVEGELEVQIRDDCERMREALRHANEDNRARGINIEQLRLQLEGLSQRLLSKIVTAALLDQGAEAEHVILGLPDDSDSNTLLAKLAPFKSRVLVVSTPPPGAAAFTSTPISTRLALYLAVALRAKEYHKWVGGSFKGIYTADPKKVPSATLVPFISPEEAGALGKLVQKEVLDKLMANNIPVRIRWFGGRQDGGTLIDPALGFESMSIRSSTRAAFSRPAVITIKGNVLLLSVSNVNYVPFTQKTSKNATLSRCTLPIPTTPGRLCRLSRFGVVVCMINTSEGHASVVIEGGLPRNVLERVVEGLKRHGEVVVHHDMAILTVISRGLSHTAVGPTASPSEAWGIAGKAFSMLVKADIGVEVIGRVGETSTKSLTWVIDTGPSTQLATLTIAPVDTWKASQFKQLHPRVDITWTPVDLTPPRCQLREEALIYSAAQTERGQRCSRLVRVHWRSGGSHKARLSRPTRMIHPTLFTPPQERRNPVQAEHPTPLRHAHASTGDHKSKAGAASVKAADT
ncbi:hypothetical protein BDN71DRAFT_1432092 [Pleurotus eryngii]|uniref:Aspartate/glutamate/uridylate kinase domain-containing protein n=1 Tax=Pleurotus eryngii TaxID=5323 RepID=A0A9P5ZTJ4_PLEER|nr:hypothetical protein BDN71DRAFT_1432092 [Pleurotus eryngii]